MELIESARFEELDREYYEVLDNSYALLRAQVQLESTWLLAEIRRNIGYTAKILVLGCGPGYLSNELSKAGHNVTAVDFSTDELKIAEMRDESRRVKYIQADLYKLPFPSSSFDVVTGLDLLEYLSNPSKMLMEASRVLHPGGLFFFNSHSKNFLSYLFSVKGPELLVKDPQRNRRNYALFSSPRELEHHLDEVALDTKKICGLRPALMQRALWQMLFHRKVTAPFRYTWSRWNTIAFLGYSKKFREH